MIESLRSDTALPPAETGNGEKILQWRKNERMGGMVPVWVRADGAQQKIADNIARAAGGDSPAFQDALDGALAYNGRSASAALDPGDEFGFGDLVDIVNPLQHLPVIGMVYREITGDDIRPIARIVGGGIFGGPAGAAVGLVDTVVEYETGRSMAGNVVAMMTESDLEKLNAAHDSTSGSLHENAIAPREPITELALDPMPPRPRYEYNS